MIFTIIVCYSLILRPPWQVKLGFFSGSHVEQENASTNEGSALSVASKSALPSACVLRSASSISNCKVLTCRSNNA